MIDRVSIERSTGYAKSVVEYTLELASKFKKDPEKDQRIKTGKCVVCHYRGEGQQITSAKWLICPLCECGGRTAGTNMICLECAIKNKLCRRCGGDVDLKSRRKPRPYETINPNGKSLIES